MVRIRRFSVIRTANVVALIYAIVVAILAIPLVLLFLAVSNTFQRPGLRVPVIGAGEVVTFAITAIIAYGIGGWIATAIGCLIYNFAAKLTGGIEVEVDRFERPAPQLPATWGTAPGPAQAWQQGRDASQQGQHSWPSGPPPSSPSWQTGPQRPAQPSQPASPPWPVSEQPWQPGAEAPRSWEEWQPGPAPDPSPERDPSGPGSATR